MPGAMLDSEEFASEKGKTRSRTAVQFMAQGLKEKENLKLSRIRREADAFIVFDLGRWTKDGRDSHHSANGVINIFEVVPRVLP